MQKFITTLILVLVGLATSAVAQTPPTVCTVLPANTAGAVVVTDTSEFFLACNNPPASRVILMAPGTYEGDVTCSGSGDAERPVTTLPQDPLNPPIVLGDEVADTGRWTIAGNHNRITGLIFDKSYVHVTGGLNRVTRNIFRGATTGFDTSNLRAAVGITGTQNRVDYNTIGSVGTPYRRRGIQVLPNATTFNNRVDNNHLINLTGITTSNTGEAFRDGADNQAHLRLPRTLWERNIIDRFDNDFEVVSIKTRGAIFRNNRVRNIIGSQSRFSIRFGAGALIEKNNFENFSSPRGVAVLGRDHVVAGNRFFNTNLSLDAGNTTFQAMLDNPNPFDASPPGLGGCFPAAENIVVAHNRFVGSPNFIRNGFVATGSCTVPAVVVAPLNLQFFNNQGQVFVNGPSPGPVSSIVTFPGSLDTHTQIEASDVGHLAVGDEFCAGPAPPGPGSFAGRLVEPIHNTTTDPGATIINAAGCQTPLQNAPFGATVLMNTGDCTVDGTLVVDNISIFPNGGSTVSIRSNSGPVIAPGSNTTIAGIFVDGNNASQAIRVDPAMHGGGTISDITIRRSLIEGAGALSLVSVVGQSDRVTFVENVINGGGGPLSGDGNTVEVFDGPDDVVFLDNVIMKNAAALGIANFGDRTGSLVELRDACNVHLEGNSFAQADVGSDGVIRAESTLNGCSYEIDQNHFHGPALATEGACILVGLDTVLDDCGSQSIVDIHHNIFNECGAAGGSRGAIAFGSSAADSNVGQVRNNLIISPNDSAEAISIRDASDISIVENTIVDGGMEIVEPLNLEVSTISVMRDNLFLSVDWRGDRLETASIGACSHNNNSGSTGSIPSSCTDTTTRFPTLESCSHPNYHCSPRDATFLSELGTNGAPRGAINPPIPELTGGLAPEIGDVDPQIVSVRFGPEFPVIQNVDTSAFTVLFGATPQILTAGFVTGGNAVNIRTTAPPAPGTVVTISALVRWCEDNLDFGNIDASLGAFVDVGLDPANGGCRAISSRVITNNVSGVVNGSPLAVDDSVSTISGVGIQINPISNDTDPDLDTLSLGLVPGLSDQGRTLIREDNGTPGDATDDFVTYLPLDFSGIDTFTYEVLDGQGGSDLGLVTIDVAPVNIGGGTFFVNANTGSDFNTTIEIQNASTPAQTIGRALLAALEDGTCEGDEVRIATGVYREQVIVQCSGSFDDPFVVNAAPGGNVLVDGTGVSLLAGDGLVSLAQSTEFVKIEGLRVENANVSNPGSLNPCINILPGNSNHITLSELVISGCASHAIRFSAGTQDVRIEAVSMSDCHGTSCIRLDGVSRVEIIGSHVHDSLSQSVVGDHVGIEIRGSRDVLVEDTRFDNLCSGIRVDELLGVPSQEIMIRRNRAESLGGATCAEAIGYVTQGQSQDIRYIGNICRADICVATRGAATRVRHIHGTYVGEFRMRIAGCDGAPTFPVGDFYEITNSILWNPLDVALSQWNAPFSGAWTDHILGDNNVIEGSIEFDSDGRQNGVLCPDALTNHGTSEDFTQFQLDTSLFSQSEWGDPRLVNEDVGDFALRAGSIGIDAGQCLLTVDTSVVDQRSVDVSGASAVDLTIPLGLFFSRTTGDLLRVQSDNDLAPVFAPVTARTPTNITFSSPVTLDAGDCLGPLNLLGTAPDIGAVETNATGTGTAKRLQGGVFRGGNF